jgi:hypothetical protein
MEKLTQNEIEKMLAVIDTLESIAYKKLSMAKANNYSHWAQIFYNDIKHINEIIEKEV